MIHCVLQVFPLPFQFGLIEVTVVKCNFKAGGQKFKWLEIGLLITPVGWVKPLHMLVNLFSKGDESFFQTPSTWWFNIWFQCFNFGCCFFHPIWYDTVQRCTVRETSHPIYGISPARCELQRHSLECTPSPGRTVYILYPTDGPDLESDLQNQIYLFLSPNQLVQQKSSESVYRFLIYHAIQRHDRSK